jgi:hypothetical protein
MNKGLSIEWPSESSSELDPGQAYCNEEGGFWTLKFVKNVIKILSPARQFRMPIPLDGVLIL